MKSSCIIVDDEHPARLLLNEYCNKLPQIEVKGTFKNPVEALNFLRDNEVDIMLLDIQMPELTGIEFLKSLTKKPKVIFTTAYPNYALDGYALDVIDYLLKPIRLERFLQAINKALDIIALEKLKKSDPVTTDKKIMTVKADHKIHRINIDEIKYIEGLREYVKFHLKDEVLIVLESLKKLEENLPASQFIRIHKSYIVNKDKVKALYGNQVQIEEKYIPIGKSYREIVSQQLL